MQHLSTLLHTFGHVWHTFGHPTETCCNMLDGFGLSSGYCKMLRTSGQFLHIISQHDPTLLQDVTLKCCVRLSCSAHFHFVFWISFPNERTSDASLVEDFWQQNLKANYDVFLTEWWWIIEEECLTSIHGKTAFIKWAEWRAHFDRFLVMTYWRTDT